MDRHHEVGENIDKTEPVNLDAIKLKCFTIVDRHHEVGENIDRTEPRCNKVKMFHYSGQAS